MRDEHRGVAHMRHDLVGRAHVFLQPLHARRGIAVLHGLVGPGQVELAARHPVAAGGEQRLLEHVRQHEAVADDRDVGGHGKASRMAACACQTGGIACRVRR